MHVGSNPNCEYIMAGAVLKMVNNKRDIGVLVNQDDIKPSLLCAEASRRASTVPGKITRSILCLIEPPLWGCILNLSAAT